MRIEWPYMIIYPGNMGGILSLENFMREWKRYILENDVYIFIKV